MVGRGLVKPELAIELFEKIAPDLNRFPAIDLPSFRAGVRKALGGD